MADLRNGYSPDCDADNAVCIDVGRVYDSCCEQQLTIYT